MAKRQSFLKIKTFPIENETEATIYSRRDGGDDSFLKRYVKISQGAKGRCDKHYVVNFTEGDSGTSRIAVGDPFDDIKEGSTLEGYKAYREWKDWVYSSEWIKNHNPNIYSQLCKRDSEGNCQIPVTSQEIFDYEEILKGLDNYSCLAAQEFIDEGWEIVAKRALEKYEEAQTLRRKEIAESYKNRRKLFGDGNNLIAILSIAAFITAGVVAFATYKGLKK